MPSGCSGFRSVEFVFHKIARNDKKVLGVNNGNSLFVNTDIPPLIQFYRLQRKKESSGREINARITNNEFKAYTRQSRRRVLLR